MRLNNGIAIKFKKSFEDKCLRLIVSAYNKILSENIDVSTFMENDISTLLNKNIESSSKSIEWQIFSKTENYLFKENQLIEKGFADKQSRIDFVFSVFTSKMKYEYFIEAKNLKEKNTKLKRRYINTGINSFTTKKYENGSLVGYLLEGSIDKTVIGINSLLKKDKRESEVLVEKRFQNHKYYYESEHQEIGTLKHLVFYFSNVGF